MGHKVNFPFFQVPNSIFDDRELDLKSSEKLVLIYICRCSNQGAIAYPSYKKIAEKCGISRPVAITAVKNLAKKGYIQVTKRPKDNKDNDSNIYTIMIKPSKGDLLAPSKGDLPGVVKDINQTSKDSLPNKELRDKELIDKESIDHFFEKIWDLYPRKVGKGRISQETKKKLFKIGFEELKRAINRYKADKPEWQEWQHGSTFFNSGHIDYLDENHKGVGSDGNSKEASPGTPGKRGSRGRSSGTGAARKNEDYYRRGFETFYK